MVFSSLTFLCIFLPAVFIIYSLVPNLRFRNALLIIASLVFYAYGEPVYVLLMIFSSVLNYICALFVRTGRGKNKAVLIIAVVINLAILGVFKYTGFLVGTVNNLFSLSIPVPEIALPVGISFFTFQALSYVIDVYRGDAKVQKNYFSVLLYITFFPQLIAGPIVKYRDIDEQIMNRSQSIEKIARGLRRFICGLGKKVLIANTMGQTADIIFNSDVSALSLPAAWLGAIAYLFQIYYDFCGYSDMAIGLGLMFGFEFKENFMYPYGAVSIQDFWRRWHISLSTWFKEYLYIPLGGNRKGKARTYLNKMIVFFCTGLWHGASWTFVLWGVYHGLFLLLEGAVPAIKKLPRVIAHIYTLLVVTVGFVLFRADTIGQGITVIGKMFAGFSFTDSSLSLALTQLTPWFILMLVAAIIGCAPIRPLADKLRANLYGEAELSTGMKVVQITLYALAFVLLFWCMIRLSATSYNPFIYFRF
ncbi:MBOAT family protein [uncultured Ruminococcus sp.]|uniref:MBOAT family O-acyltransferase n=1 Tax=uncultured Ruminococcus sp. TaxID=165186 RepID=UPI00292E4731|nr:MBOAT family protein [uncultured Ruminococcus sp.]